MESLVILTFIMGIGVGMFISLMTFKKPKTKEKPKDDPYGGATILKLRNGQFVPYYRGEYPFIYLGTPDLHSMPSNSNTFNTHEGAQKYLDRWIAYKGVDVINVGIYTKPD